MPANDIRPKVWQWLDEMFQGVEQLDTGTIFVPHFGSTALFVEVQDVFSDQHVRVRIDAPILVDVPATRELFEYIGYRSNDFLFGSLALMRDPDDQKGILVFRQSIMGDAIDKIELEMTTKVTAATADDMDNDLVIRFGGRTFYN